MFSEILVKEGFKTIEAPDDVDTLILRTTLGYSKEKQVKVIGEDTDVLSLVWHYIHKDVHQVIFQSESRTWNIQHLIHKTGHMIEVILIIHALLGCEAVFRIYGIGKDKITKSPKLVNICRDVAPIF